MNTVNRSPTDIEDVEGLVAIVKQFYTEPHVASRVNRPQARSEGSRGRPSQFSEASAAEVRRISLPGVELTEAEAIDQDEQRAQAEHKRTLQRHAIVALYCARDEIGDEAEARALRFDLAIESAQIASGRDLSRYRGALGALTTSEPPSAVADTSDDLGWYQDLAGRIRELLADGRGQTRKQLLSATKAQRFHLLAVVNDLVNEGVLKEEKRGNDAALLTLAVPRNGVAA